MRTWLNKLISRRSFVAGSAATGSALATTGTLSACAQQTKASSKLAIIHTNDTHGYDLLSDESLGLAAVAQLKADYEAKGYEVLLLDAGDAVQGEILVNRSRERRQSTF